MILVHVVDLGLLDKAESVVVDAIGDTGYVEIFPLKDRMKRFLGLLGHLIGSKVDDAAQVERLVALLNVLLCERGYNRLLDT